jgi:hypothetical protein
MKVAAGVVGAVIIGSIIKEMMDQGRCNTVPKRFETGTLNAEILGVPVVRRTCEQADWFYGGTSAAVRHTFAVRNGSVGSLLDPPRQMDFRAAAAESMWRALEILEEILGSPRGIDVTEYGKLRYKPLGEGTTEEWVNLVALDFSGAKVGAQSGISSLSIPCVDGNQCVVYLSPNKMAARPEAQLFLQGRGTWQEVLTQLKELRTMFPKPPVVQAR